MGTSRSAGSARKRLTVSRPSISGMIRSCRTTVGLSLQGHADRLVGVQAVMQLDVGLIGDHPPQASMMIS